ncbi:2,5-diketo-D-gluconic acid reductase B [Corynebacterium provencense]|uniref:2,5-diketo-D-gluconic acid reductase B n=2 Tax=Corynebacterium provencense TaxID=1737425 RepID=A0A2Z3YME6_9CORY|nr:2,5-diketo-D-gluconic acid reductase B [Corynebacterium provencense]
MATMTSEPLTLPSLGFGTYKLRGEEGRSSVTTALELGYRLIDAAYNYENEGTVGAGIRDAVTAGTVSRDEVIYTTKLPGRYQRREDALDTVAESVWRAGIGPVDLYLIHWPNPGQGLYVEAWKALIEARDRGLVRHIGVCNFLPEHLSRLEDETGVLPEVNQIELHPSFPQNEPLAGAPEGALAWNTEHGIITESWSPLGRGTSLDSEPVRAAAAAHDATPGQVILAWHRALGAVAIPKASSRARQQENLESLQLELTDAEIAAITALGRPDGRLNDQDPAVYEEF